MCSHLYTILLRLTFACVLLPLDTINNHCGKSGKVHLPCQTTTVEPYHNPVVVVLSQHWAPRGSITCGGNVPNVRACDKEKGRGALLDKVPLLWVGHNRDHVIYS